METYKFKTNIKCGGCIAAVTPYLDKAAPGNWEVDITDPDKILVVENCELPAEEIAKAVREAGYNAEQL